MSSLKQEAKCEEVKAKCLLKHLVIMFTLTPACVQKLTRGTTRTEGGTF